MGVLQDLRFALTMLRRTPAFLLTAVCTLALGIGANTAIFSVVSGVLLRPLPFVHPDRLMQLNETSRDGIGAVTFANFDAWRKQSKSFEEMVSYYIVSKSLEGIDEPERISTVTTDRGLFHMLGVEPVRGRTFLDNDPPDVVVVGEGLWKRRFGGDPSLIGRKITLDGEGFTVIGVMPEAFQFPYRAVSNELWIPFDVPPQYRNLPGYRFDFVTGRLKDGVSPQAALDELAEISKRTEREYPEWTQGRRPVATPVSETVVGKVRNSLLVLLGAVGLVLLVACANVANLLLARAAGRRREVAIRAALGAGRSRLVRQFLTESILLAFAGGLLGLAIAAWGGGLLVKLTAAQIPRYSEIGLDWRVFTFLLVACVVTGIGFGLAPAMAAARVDVNVGLKESSAPAKRRGMLRDGLVVAEIALAFLLLIGAGLLFRAFLNLQRTNLGVVAENVLTLHLSVSETQARAPGAGAVYLRGIEERVGEIPGVRAAGFVSLLPLESQVWSGHFSIVGGRQDAAAELRYVSPGYFRALGIPIRKGRGLTDRDTLGAPGVVLINEALARLYFSGEDPVGRTTDRGTIAGVVGDVREFGLDRPATPEIYYPLAQNFAQLSSTGMSLVVSAQGPAELLTGAVRSAIHEVDPNQAIFGVKTMRRVIAESMADLSLYLWLIGLFAGLALLLAVAGVYGVTSYAVTERTREYGIRVALGAEASRVLALVLRRGAVVVALGIAVGACGALALTRLLESLLFEVTPTDPATFAAMATLLAGVALMACLVPARRATKVDPVIALRYE
jgi:putative ABC transport system permease protein